MADALDQADHVRKCCVRGRALARQPERQSQLSEAADLGVVAAIERSRGFGRSLVVERKPRRDRLLRLLVPAEIEVDRPDAMLDLQGDFAIFGAKHHRLHFECAVVHDEKVRPGQPPAPIDRKPLWLVFLRLTAGDGDAVFVQLSGGRRIRRPRGQ